MNSNGNTIDREGRLITCEHSGRRVTRTEHDGSITVVADKYNGKRLNSPNDAVVAADGSIWFTDPVYGIGGFYEGIKEEPEQAKHNVFRVDPKSGEVKVVVDDFVEPNGLGFSPDEKKLYVIDTGFTDGPDNPSAHSRLRRGCRERQAIERQGLCGNAQAQHFRRGADRHRGACLVLGGLGRRERGRCALLNARRRSLGQDPHSGNGRKPVLRRHAAKQALHLRLDLALRRLHECARRDEALTWVRSVAGCPLRQPALAGGAQHHNCLRFLGLRKANTPQRLFALGLTAEHGKPKSNVLHPRAGYVR
jgi:hypothetical protein